MYKLTKVSAGVLLACGTGIAAFAPSAVAQQATQQLERIEITGSRIKRVDTETTQPIFTLKREDILAQGLTSVGDVIQNITANGSALNTTYNNGGNGETRVSLRNLGSGRTLVLVNGRRWVGGTGLGGAVDLTTIPTAAVDRIDVLKDGASVTYGSDAIAGVVNIILRKDFQGAEANVYYGVYDKGDGERMSVDAVIGAAGERFRSMMGVGYVKENPVGAGARTISAEPVYTTGTAFGSSTSPNGRFALCDGVFNSVAGGCAGTQERPDGSAGQFTYAPGGTPAAWRAWSAATDIYNFAPDNYLVTPQERVSVFGKASFDVVDSVSANLLAVFNNRKSEQLLAAMPIVLGTGPGANTQSRTVSISPDSIYNPFGQTVARIQRRAVETGGRSFKQDITTIAVTASLEGEFNLGGVTLNWDIGSTYGRNQQSDRTDGLFNVAALRNALGPSMRDAAGNPVCVTAAGNLGTRVPGCVPLNLLGGVGSITREMLDYTSFVAQDTYGSTMSQTFANVSAELVKLPAGMLAVAAGLERRSEKGFDQPDALIASGNTTGNARTPTSGGYSIQEGYVELSVPLLKNLPLVKKLDLSLAARTSDYSNFGKTTNSKAGVRWQVADSLMIRGNWSEGFRAPSIAELYQGVSDNFPQIGDPCSTTFGGSYGNLTGDQKARCHRDGVPVGGYDQGNAQIRTDSGGNPFLQPEQSKTKTLGFVFSPSFLTGFDMTFDWWQIKLQDVISGVGGSEVLNECYLEGNANACQLVTRAAGGQITQLIEASLNRGNRTVEGYDLTVNYRLPRTAFGTFSATWDTTYMEKFLDSDGSNLIGQYFDRDNYWRIRSNLNVRWEMGDFGATWGARYYDKQTESCADMSNSGFGDRCSMDDTQNGDNARNKLGATTYHDVSVYWKAPWKGRVTLGVNNINAKNPPTSYSTFANSFDPAYEIPGRFFYLRYSQSF